MSGIRDLLHALGRSATTDAALDDSVGQSERELDLEWRAALASRRR
jgi:hypothetical protein